MRNFRQIQYKPLLRLGGSSLFQLHRPAHRSAFNTIDIKLNKVFKDKKYFNSIQIKI